MRVKLFIRQLEKTRGVEHYVTFLRFLVFCLVLILFVTLSFRPQ